MPYAAGVILTRHPKILERAFSVAAAYMPKTSGATLPDNARISTQWTRRMNSLKLWLTLKVHGRRAYEEHIHRQLQLTEDFAKWVEASEEFELVIRPVLPIINIQLKARGGTADQIASAHNAIVDEVTRDGQRWISETMVNGQSVIRIMIISYLTEERHLDALKLALCRSHRLRMRSFKRLLRTGHSNNHVSTHKLISTLALQVLPAYPPENSRSGIRSARRGPWDRLQRPISPSCRLLWSTRLCLAVAAR